MAARAVVNAAFYGGLGLAGLGAVSGCLYDVDGGERAVIFDRFQGVLENVRGEGTHLLIPFLQEAIIMDVRARPRIIHSKTGTKDLQMVNLSLRVLSRPAEEQLPRVYKELGTDFDDRVLPSVGNEILKATVALYNAEELLSKRATISAQIRDTMTARAKNFGLILDDVSITHLTFGKEFAKAIENKQVAQQEAERQTFVVMQAEQEKKAAVIRAEGEAEAARLISQAIAESGDGLIELRRIDAAKEVASTLAKSRNVTYLPNSKGGSGLLLGVSGN